METKENIENPFKCPICSKLLLAKGVEGIKCFFTCPECRRQWKIIEIESVKLREEVW